MTDDRPWIYAVDDEEGIRELYQRALGAADLRIRCFAGADELFAALEEELPALLLLDVMLEGADGYEILTRLRADARTRDLPVIMVSAKGEEGSKVKGLDLGADDYLAKPFGVSELIARIRAWLRRCPPQKPLLAYGDIVMDEGRHTVEIAGAPAALTRKEYDLLRRLLISAGQVVSREDIRIAVWGAEYIGETRTLDIHMATLRKHLTASRAEIVTVRGVGYMLQ